MKSKEHPGESKNLPIPHMAKMRQAYIGLHSDRLHDFLRDRLEFAVERRDSRFVRGIDPDSADTFALTDAENIYIEEYVSRLAGDGKTVGASVYENLEDVYARQIYFLSGKSPGKYQSASEFVEHFHDFLNEGLKEFLQEHKADIDAHYAAADQIARAAAKDAKASKAARKR